VSDTDASDEWYFVRNHQQHGPVTWGGMRAMAGAGNLLPADLVWRPGMEQWQLASEVEGLFPPAAVVAPAWKDPSASATAEPAWPQPVPPPPGDAGPGAPPGYAPPGYAPPDAAPGQPVPAQPLTYGGYATSGQSHRGTAIAAFVMSLVGLVACGIGLGIAAIVVSQNALQGMRSSGNEDGKGFAIAARVIGIVGLALWGLQMVGWRLLRRF
jgi:hypothetical protein